MQYGVKPSPHNEETKKSRKVLMDFLKADLKRSIPDHDASLETTSKLRKIEGSYSPPEPSTPSASEDDRREDRGSRYLSERGEKSADGLYSFNVADDASDYSPASSELETASIDSLDVNAGD